MLIDASSPRSFPPELFDVVQSHIATMPEDEKDAIRKILDKSKQSICIGTEKHFSPTFTEGYYMYQDELIPVFDRYELLCFHATRVPEIDSIRRYGIISDMSQYEERMRSFLKSEQVERDRIEATIESIRHEYTRKYGRNPHQICFFINLKSLYSEDGSAAYDQFYETVGGELAKWALEEKMPDILGILQTKGTPIVVRCAIPFAKIADYHKGSLISSFVYYVAAKYFWDENIEVEADSSLIGNIVPCEILDIIPVAAGEGVLR